MHSRCSHFCCCAFSSLFIEFLQVLFVLEPQSNQNIFTTKSLDSNKCWARFLLFPFSENCPPKPPTFSCFSIFVYVLLLLFIFLMFQFIFMLVLFCFSFLWEIVQFCLFVSFHFVLLIVFEFSLFVSLCFKTVASWRTSQ